MSPNFLTEQLAGMAENIVDTLVQTDYQFNEQINAGEGIYDCDCNSYVGFILEALAPQHYAMIPKEPGQPRPRAFKYYEFFVNPALPEGWRRIFSLADAQRGDIVAWRFPQITMGQNTGHVFFVAETPWQLESGPMAVRVYDSAQVPHFEDTRGSGADQFPNGVGSGIINFEIDAAGAPTAFQFGPGTLFVSEPIAIGRAEPL
jgi:hypothetical protein